MAVAAGVIFVVVDALFLAAGRNTDNQALFWLWVAVQASLCFVGGCIQALRRRHLVELLAVAGIATAALLVVVVAMVNPDAGSQDCPSRGPCDTSFALGYVLIAVVVMPVFAALSGIGYAAIRTVRRAAGG